MTCTRRYHQLTTDRQQTSIDCRQQQLTRIHLTCYKTSFWLLLLLYISGFCVYVCVCISIWSHRELCVIFSVTRDFGLEAIIWKAVYTFYSSHIENWKCFRTKKKSKNAETYWSVHKSACVCTLKRENQIKGISQHAWYPGQCLRRMCTAFWFLWVNGNCRFKQWARWVGWVQW
jgi:hypothetical protein